MAVFCALFATPRRSTPHVARAAAPGCMRTAHRPRPIADDISLAAHESRCESRCAKAGEGPARHIGAE
ncbi:hypothetical protein WS81_27670 [Burkholderia sp. MSMB2040]|nr:hypothetical protein WS81_27670 [Burkholderia sp. MSMB2040]